MEDVNFVLDPIFTIAAPHLGEIGSSNKKITADPSPFELDEVEAALCSLNLASFLGPDGVNARELRKLPTEIVTHTSSWYSSKSLPNCVYHERFPFPKMPQRRRRRICGQSWYLPYLSAFFPV